jgi:hypothetical protein
MLLLIFAMAAFIGCSNGTTDDDPLDDPVVPVDPVDPVDPTDPVDPVDPNPPVTVTGITIDPANLEILAGGRHLFKAVVSGTAADKTVKWSVAIADEDYNNVKEDGTTISDNKGAGLLVIDAGQYWGTILTVTATSNADPSFFAEATVTVVKPGPRLSWTPNNISVTAVGEEGSIDEDGTSVGRLLDIFGKDIRVFDGEYIEGEHYYIRRVDNLNNSIQGGTVSVIGSADEGTITVTLNGNVIGDKGPIGITLYPSVLEGTDASVIDFDGPGAELVFNVTSDQLITSLSSLNDYVVPLNGSAPRFAGNTVSPSMTQTVTWAGLSSGAYTHRSPAVATITLSASAGYRFYIKEPNGIKESTILAKFQNGAPEVKILAKSSSTLKFTLTYTIAVKTIVVGTPASLDYVSTVFRTYLRDMIATDLVNHNKEAPVTLWQVTESPLYSLNQPVVWTGLTGKNFFGGRSATATITIPAKPGYTFEGTNITIGNLVGPAVDAVFKEGTPAGEIISAGDSLVFTLTYYVPKADITTADIASNVSGKLPVPVIGATPVSNLTVNKNASFTGGSGAVTWTGLSINNKFAADRAPTATVTLLAKDGYKFADALIGGTTTLTQGDIAVTGTATVTFNLGNKLEVEIEFTRPATAINVITLGGKTGLPGSLVHGTNIAANVTASEGAQIYEIGSSPYSTFAWTDGKTGTDMNYSATLSHTLTAEVVLKPKVGYTFAGVNISNTIRDYYRNFFAIGTTLPSATLVVNGNDLQITLVYPIARKLVLNAGLTFTGGTTGINSGDIEHLAPLPSVTADIAGGTPQVKAISVVDGDSTFTWTAGLNGDGDEFDWADDTGTATAIVRLVPTADYTFAGYNEILGANTGAIATLFTFNGSVAPATPVLDVDGDDLVVTLEYTIAPAVLTDVLLPVTAFTDFTDAPVASGPTSSVGTPGVIGSALVTIAGGAAWTSGVTLSDFDGAGTAVYTLTLVPKSGYTFAGSTEADFEAVLEDLDTAPTVSATISGVNLIVTLSYTL